MKSAYFCGIIHFIECVSTFSFVFFYDYYIEETREENKIPISMLLLMFIMFAVMAISAFRHNSRVDHYSSFLSSNES